MSLIYTSPRRLSLWLFLFASALAIAFAVRTNHVWEDYYITYRSSKNLATGHGLVYNVGERLHTFTSPLGVLLPAFSSLAVGNRSDTAALWVFRALSVVAFASAITLLFNTALRIGFSRPAQLFLATALIFDAKSVDFTINGMETGFMLLFLSYAFWALLAARDMQCVHLGVAWAGLMWTRPDSFIYIGFSALGLWLFNSPKLTGRSRLSLVSLYLQAGALTTLIYAPWVLWATWYYGTPIPHTIIAKGAQGGGLLALDRLLNGCWRLPLYLWQDKVDSTGIFLPAYSAMPAWPDWIHLWSKTWTLIPLLLWIIPGVRREVRMASFAFYGATAYLAFIPYYPFPWYYPPVLWLGVFAVAGLLTQLWETRHAWLKIPTGLVAACLLVGGIALFIEVGQQVRAQQIFVEDGNRRRIGEWLRLHASPGDKVFMEPLGYIGFYSNLKTYDWPGLSSREVVEAGRLVGTDWESLIMFLQPDWVVLRVSGEGDMNHVSSALSQISFERIKDFDRSAEIQRLDIPGRRLLEFDSHYAVYHRKYPTRHDIDGFLIASPIGSSVRRMGSAEVRMVHAPGKMLAVLPGDATSVRCRFGFPVESIMGDHPTDGADFEVWVVDGRQRTRLYHRTLLPLTHANDRGLQEVSLPLPPRRQPTGAYLVLATLPHESLSQDWTCWTNPEFLSQ